MRLPAADRKRPTPLDGVVALLVAAAALALLMMLRPSGGGCGHVPRVILL